MAIDVITLTDPSGASASIAPALGFNCFAWRAMCEGTLVPGLWAHPEFTGGGERPSGSGVPILFPFPGRIKDGVYRWQGREYRLEQNDRRGNAIHGFVFNRPWRVVMQSAASVTGEFQASVDAPEVLEQWPADFCIRATYGLTATRLELEVAIDNPSARDLPFGLGLHPYFRVPLGGPAADACTVRVPVTREWELENLVPTGGSHAIERPWAWSEGQRLGGLTLDNVFGGLAFQEGHAAGEIHDPGAGRSLFVRFGSAFRECVLYIPPHREALCIEPYTCVPDPIRLTDAGLDAGLAVLPPGERRTYAITMEIAAKHEADDDNLWQRVHRAAC
jgi:aldose 1-epimerase